VGGVPAKVIKTLDPAQVAGRKDRFEYIGFHPLAGSSRARLYERLEVALPLSPPALCACPGAASGDRNHRK